MTATTSSGRCWVFGDDINTDVLAPGQYIKAPIETLAAHCLETINADFAAGVTEGDIIVAGKNFGIGSSREQAAQALIVLGIRGVVAQSYGGIFFRNAINLGLPVFTPLSLDGPVTAVEGNNVQLNSDDALLFNHSNGQTTQLKPLPDFLLQMVKAGGLVSVLEKRFSSAGQSGDLH